MRPLVKAGREARRVLSETGIVKIPVDVFRIARRHAQVVEMRMDDDISGMLVPLNKPAQKWAIIVNSSHAEVRQRFTVAHELGHLILHGFRTPHADRGFKVRFRSSRSTDISVAEEIEANHFAAELLMPADALLARVKDIEIDFAMPNKQLDALLRRAAKEFKVSRQALDIRVSDLVL